LIAREFIDDIKTATVAGKPFRAIVPCGPKCWYAPFTRMVNDEKVSLHHLTVFHMDECLNWEGKLLPVNDPYNFKTFMEKYFHGGIQPELAVPHSQRFFPDPSTINFIKIKIDEAREVALRCLAAATADEVEELVRTEFKARWPELFPPNALPK